MEDLVNLMLLYFSDKKFGSATKFQSQTQYCHVIGSILFRALQGSKRPCALLKADQQ